MNVGFCSSLIAVNFLQLKRRKHKQELVFAITEENSQFSSVVAESRFYLSDDLQP